MNKYTVLQEICNLVFKLIKEKISNGTSSVKDLCEYSDTCLLTELKKQKFLNIGIGAPTSISLNNCVGNYIYEEGNDRYNNIQKGDVIKISYGAYIDDCCVTFGDTIIG